VKMSIKLYKKRKIPNPKEEGANNEVFQTAKDDALCVKGA